MEIVNVGLDFSKGFGELGNLIMGFGIIYSRDESDEPEDEFIDEFEFIYDKTDDSVTYNLDPVFKDYEMEIAEMLLENIRTNLLEE